ncbi:MAG: glutamine synthetase family protein [Candidatus Bathyarchaeota archaeon]|nr:glutamine synthetase family protein [Candidatus Bathyarchaeota archaeon]
MKVKGLVKDQYITQIQEKGVRIVNLCHIPDDCRLKTLSFTAKTRNRLEEILEFGERVDGSSLFPYINPDRSDVYIIPRTESAFIDPFNSLPTLNILCDYFDEDGKPMKTAPQNILRRAEEKLFSSNSTVLNGLAELEFYVIQKKENVSDPSEKNDSVQTGNYQESTPIAKFGDLRNEALATLEDIGFAMKYGHAEVGRFYSKNGCLMEQQEIEFLPRRLSRMAETITIAKWVVRNICEKHGVTVSFSPKPALEHAGNGMHIHLYPVRGNRNVISDSEGNLTSEAKQIIGGILKFSRSLAAFGNTIPVSYLRFLSRSESPMHICWEAKNRLALIRIPLWWRFEKPFRESENSRRTFEYRGPDPSASNYLLFAGIAVAANYGLRNPKEAMKIAQDLNIGEKTELNKKRELLPLSCTEAADNLRRDREYYEGDGVFPKTVIDSIINRLESYKDGQLRTDMAANQSNVESLILRYLEYG